MYSMWRGLFIVATILLVSCAALGSSLWYELNVTKEQLANTVTELYTAVAQLADTTTLLDTTKTQLVNTEARLETAKKELTATENQLETAENENSQMVSQYASLKSQIDARLAPAPQDRQSFITPGNSSVSAKVQEITGGYSEDVNERWRDYERLYRWVVDNISYSHDSYMPVLPGNISGELIWLASCWRMPEETLGDETGDCEDMALLLASMLLSCNEGNYTVWLLGIRTSIPEEKGHLAVAFPVAGGKLVILDPAGNYYTGYQYGSLRSESASAAVSEWLSHWTTEMPGAEIVEAFSEGLNEEFSSTAEFLKWLKERNS